VILNGGKLFIVLALLTFLLIGRLTVNSNADNVKISWRITLRTNGPLKVRHYILLSQFGKEGIYKSTLPAVLIGKKNLEVRPTAVNKVTSALDGNRVFGLISLFHRAKLSNESSTKTQTRSLYSVLEMTKYVLIPSFLKDLSSYHPRPTKTCSGLYSSSPPVPTKCSWKHLWP